MEESGMTVEDALNSVRMSLRDLGVDGLGLSESRDVRGNAEKSHVLIRKERELICCFSFSRCLSSSDVVACYL